MFHLQEDDEHVQSDSHILFWIIQLCFHSNTRIFSASPFLFQMWNLGQEFRICSPACLSLLVKVPQVLQKGQQAQTQIIPRFPPVAPDRLTEMWMRLLEVSFSRFSTEMRFKFLPKKWQQQILNCYMRLLQIILTFQVFSHLRKMLKVFRGLDHWILVLCLQVVVHLMYSNVRIVTKCIVISLLLHVILGSSAAKSHSSSAPTVHM